MRKTCSQKGIALVVVLLMITVFSILGLSVMGYAISNAKQVEKSEQDMQAVDLAEMGVIHYKNAFIKNAEQLLSSAVNDVNQTGGSDLRNQLDQELIKRKNDFYLKIQDQSIGAKGSYSVIPPSDSNNIFTWDSDNHISKISITFKSIGKVDPKIEKRITSTIALDITKLVKTTSSGGGGGTGSGQIEMIVSKPTGLKSCNFTNTIEQNCSYNTDIDLTTDGSINNIPGIFYIGGNGNFGTITGGIDKSSNIYIVGNAAFDDISGGINKDSVIYIGGNATFNNISGGIKKDSHIYIGGNATFNNIKFHKDTALCVGGSITIDGTESYPEGTYSYKHDKAAYLIAVQNGICPDIKETSNGTGTKLSFDAQFINKYTTISNDYN